MAQAQEIVTHQESPAPAAVQQAQSEAGALISMIERAARDQNVDIEKFERLLAVKERVEAAAARRAFNEAVSMAKGEIPPIIKNRVVDFTSQKGRTHYRHEDLAGIASVVDPILNKHGLSYRFRSTQDGNRVTVTCILSHKDGYAEETALSAGEDHSGNKNAHQAIGSAATYLQRYTLKLALGLSASNDDDARSSGEATADASELRAEGERIARDEGMTALGMWWTKTITAADRKALGTDALTNLKKIAQESA